jgi:hypothetical protein
MRQPPEKLLTGFSSSLTLEAQAQDQRLGARQAASWAPASCSSM